MSGLLSFLLALYQRYAFNVRGVLPGTYQNLYWEKIAFSSQLVFLLGRNHLFFLANKKAARISPCRI
ncbi:MAG: hypothetical protein SOZ01_03720, partial [Selenomonadaceae bacterium]|nr:hypothetical protein [Selenomonadaceae bacterium]